MLTRILSVAVLLGSFCAAHLSAQQFIDLPAGSWVNDITPDGKIVAGNWNFYDSFIWKWQDEPAPTVITGNGAIQAISDDGTVAAGSLTDAVTGEQVAAIWTEATGWQPLGGLTGPCGLTTSTGYDISGDGTTVVGLAWVGCSARGFRWTASTGMQELQNLANGNNRASAISGDGTAIGGFAQGTFDRTPAFWDQDNLGELVDADELGEVFGFNEDGSLSVGEYIFPGKTWGEGFLRDAATGVITNLGSLDSNWTGNATDLSEDGSTVVGFDAKGFGRKAWVWTAQGGMVSLNQHILDLGLPATEALQVCRAVSDDGNIIVGGGYDPEGFPFFTGGFILVQSDIPASTWTDLGGGTAGISGVPGLDGSGTLAGGTTATLDLTNAPANALMLAWLSFAPVPVNAIGGTLHAAPFANQFLFSANAAGAFAASTTWPNGVPSGTEVWFQFIVQDPSSIHGLTLSNGLKAISP